MNLRVWVRDTLFSRLKQMTAPGEIRRYLAAHPSPKLNIGAGGNRIDGWLNVDRFPPPGVTFMDGKTRLPFADGTFDAVICEHMIEHVPKADAQALIGEIHRILKPGAPFRIVTPELDWFARRVLEPVPAGAPDEQYIDFLGGFLKLNERMTWSDAINNCFYEHGHCYIWSVAELSKTLTDKGFKTIRQSRAGTPIDPVFIGAEGHHRISGELNNALEAFALEALA